MPPTPTKSRVFLGFTGGVLLVAAVAVAAMRPDGLTVAAFIAGGVLLVVLAGLPTVPSKISVGSAMFEWSPEELVVTAYSEAWRRMQTGSVVGGPGVPTGGPGVGPEVERRPSLNEAKQLARNARTTDELLAAVDMAQRAAQIEAAEMMLQSQGMGGQP